MKQFGQNYLLYGIGEIYMDPEFLIYRHRHIEVSCLCSLNKYCDFTG